MWTQVVTYDEEVAQTEEAGIKATEAQDDNDAACKICYRKVSACYGNAVN